MRQRISIRRAVAYALFILIGLTAAALASDLDRYRYVLEQNKDDKVCHHMEKVYNKYIRYPWKRPSLTTLSDDPAYGPNGRYAFPKLPGVTHDNRMTSDMGYSRLPTSPEFEAIKWHDGRYRFASRPDHDRPMLVAEFDIDNDGQTDIVIKSQFMLGFEPSHGSAPGGEDTLFVFEKSAIDLNHSLTYEMFVKGRVDKKKKPAMIPGAYSRRLIRPFLLNGVVYLSTYEQVWEGGEFRDLGTRFTRLESEYMNVLRYYGGGENLGPGNWSPLQLDHVCRFRMRVVKDH